MAMILGGYDTNQESNQTSLKRATLTTSGTKDMLDTNLSSITDSNPLPTTQQLKVESVIEDTNYDLNAATYNESATSTYDYIIDNISMLFNTNESKTITITSDNGTVLYKNTDTTDLSIVLTNINFGQATGQNFTIHITQTVGACLVNVTANIKNSPVALTADPILAPGTNSVGFFGINEVKKVSGKDGVDSSTNTLQIIEYEHHEIHGGSHYFIDDFVDLSINNVSDIQITTPNTTKWLHFTFKIDSESETLWELYENVTINTAGTTLNPMNNNRNSSNTSGATFAQITNGSTALANADTAVAGATLLRRGEIGAGKDSGNESRAREIILKQNTSYTLRLTAVTAGYVDYSFNWYEHTDKN